MRHGKLLLVPLLAILIVGAACGSDKKESSSATTQQETVTKGGMLVLGAEQNGDCADWLGACAGAVVEHLHDPAAHGAAGLRREARRRVRAQRSAQR